MEKIKQFTQLQNFWSGNVLEDPVLFRQYYLSPLYKKISLSPQYVQRPYFFLFTYFRKQHLYLFTKVSSQQNKLGEV